MAASPDFEENLLTNIDDKVLQCAICMERFKSPKILPCQHTFCKICLTKWVKSNNGRLTCPTCKRTWPLPSGGVPAITDNRFMNDLLQVISEISQQDRSKAKCDGCQKQATHWCGDCGGHFYCSVCINTHRTMTVLKTHKPITVEDYHGKMSTQQFGMIQPRFCDNHPDAKLEFYCDTCQLPTCHKCTVVDHPTNDHKIMSMESALKKHLPTMKANTMKISENVRDLQHRKLKVVATKKELVQNKEGAELQIKKLSEQAIAEIKKQEMKLLGDVANIYKPKCKQIDSKIELLEHKIASAESLHSYLNHLLMFGGNVDIMTAQKYVGKQLHHEDLTNAQLGDIDSDLVFMENPRCLKINLGIVKGNNSILRGVEPSVKSVLPQLQDYIALNTEVDESVTIENGRMQYIHSYAKDAISNIQKGAKRLPLRINIQSKGHFDILTISGTEEDVKIAAKELQQLADSVCGRPYPIDKPGMAKLFMGDKGKSCMKMTEDLFKCIIKVNNPSEEDSTMPDTIHEEDFVETVPKAQPTTYQILCYYTLKDRRRIVVGKGDLTKMHVDVIVNAASTRLDFSTGGLEKAVVDAGGPEMQAECAQIIRNRGRLFEGQAVSTGAGNLPCKNVVHAVAPVWHGSRYHGWSRRDETNKAELLLTDAVRNSLEEAEKMGHTSIAIPAIGAGGNRFPLDLCVKTILEAVDSYCRMNKPKSLMEIRIVDNADTTCQKFQDTLVEQYGSSNVVITSDEKSEDWQMAPSHSGEDMEKQEGFSTGAGFQSKNNPNVFKTTEDKYITMIKDSIAKQKVDVIVNTAQTSLDLNTGAVSKAILRVAGPQLQQEVDIQKTEVSTNEGDIVVTIATGNLKCKKVFHVLCCQWDSSGKAEKLLKSVMQQCFDIADKSGMKSIAFPAIGTGGLKFPRDVTAKIMYDEAKNFSASKPKSQLTDIKFVIYDQDHETIMAFQDVITNLTGVPLRKRHQRRSPAKHDGAKKMSKKKKVHSFSPMQSPQYSLNTTAVQHHSTAGTGQNVFTSFKKSKYQWEIMIRNICVQVQRGDITAETTEAIVNSTNENLDLSRGEMSKAIMQAGGRSIVDECKMLGRQPPGAVVITGAGKLRCNHIIHVVAVTEQTLEQSIMGILQLAEQNGIISLSMPAIGTGGLGIDSNDVASKTFHVIGDFVQQVYPQNLKLIRITIFQPHIVGIFQQAMSDLLITPRAQDDRGSMEEWFGAIGSAIRQAFMGPDKEEQTVLRKQFNTIILYIYAGSQQDINGAIKHLEATMDQEFSDVVIVEDASVRKLSKEDMSNLNTLADSLNVKVYMVDTGSVSRLYIQGGPMDVMTVHKQVNVLLERIHDEERPESEAKLLAQNVRWLFLNDKEEFEEYDELTTGIIEKAFQHNKSDIILNIEEGQYKIDFKKMMESDLDNPILSVVEVRRELKEAGFSLPSSWTTMRSGKQVERVVLDPKSKEYDTVAKHFRQTMKSLPFQTIHQIERIQNPKLYHQYMVLKQNMEAKNKAGTQNERLLYHGTSADTVPKINAGGFNRSFAGKNANVYGEGSYFAVNASYSAHDTYSPPDGSRKKHMYQAKVLTGEVTTGSRGMLIAPSKNQNDPTDCYDSVVDNQQNPALFVLFNDAMAYPEYLIVFQ